MKANYIAVCKEKTVAGINIEKVLPYYQAVQSSTSEGSTWLYQPKGNTLSGKYKMLHPFFQCSVLFNAVCCRLRVPILSDIRC